MTHTNDPRDAQDVKDGLELYAEGLLRKLVETVEIHRFDCLHVNPIFAGIDLKLATFVKTVELRVLYYNTARSPEVHLVLHNGSPYCLNRKGNLAALIETSKRLMEELDDGESDYVTLWSNIFIAERARVAA